MFEDITNIFMDNGIIKMEEKENEEIDDVVLVVTYKQIIPNTCIFEKTV